LKKDTRVFCFVLFDTIFNLQSIKNLMAVYPM